MFIYTLIPLISGVSVIFLGLIVLGKNRKSKINQVFFWAILCVAIWLFVSSIMFLSKTDERAIFWDRIIYVGVVFLPVAFYHFGLLFTKIKNQRKLLYLGYFLSIIFLILSRTDYFVSDLYKYSWGVHTQARFFHHIFLFFFAFYISLFFLHTYRYYQRVKGVERTQASYVLLALFILTLSSLAFLPAYGISIPPFPYIFALICVLILALAILKYHLFEIRVILTELLVGIMGVVLLALPFLMPIFSLRILTIGIFLFFCLFGYLLVRATHQEVKRREEIEKLYEELKVLDKAKSEFVSMASHQLRTPLSAIKGYISMLVEGSYGEISERAKEKLKNVFYSNERLIRIVNDLLNISKIELGKMELEKEPCRLEDLIDSCCQEMETEAKKKNLKFIWGKPKIPFPKINLDKSKIHQVVSNLIDNAIRYTQKGEIEIKIEKTNSPEGKPSVSYGAGKIRISVRDTGEGLTKEEEKKIFEGFTRGAAGINYWIEGTGLGLYVAKKYVGLHHGKIWAESEGEGKGAIFLVELPIW